MSSYTLTIDGSDRTTCISNGTITIKDDMGSSASTMKFDMTIRDSGNIPACDEEVVITQDGTILFGGRILKVTPAKKGSFVSWKVDCVDYTRDLDRNLVVEGYQDMTDKEIIEDIIDNYCGGTGITYSNVTEGITISNLTFNYVPPSECLTIITKLTGRQWHIDYDKDIHYGVKFSDATPFNIDSDSDAYKNLRLKVDNSALRNRVYVRGGTYLSDEVTIKQVADGEQTVFYLPEKPHEMTILDGVTSKTVGIQNVDSFDDYDYLMSYQEKYIETDVAPTADNVMTFAYKYDIPVLVAVEDSTSIEAYGQFEFAIFDNNIDTIEGARDRASAELTDYADSISSGSFETLTSGFTAGEYIEIDLADLEVDESFVVKSVTSKSMGGGEFTYTIQIVSTEMLGIIQFLIGLLEGDKNSLNISSDEVVDEIATVTAETFTLDDGVPVLTEHTGAYKYDSDAQWDIAEWDTT